MSLTIRLSTTGLMLLALAGCAPPALTNYTLPNTNKVTFATCYYDVPALHLIGPERSKNFFPESVQKKNAYVVQTTREALEKHGYQVTMIGCKGAFKADNKSIRVVQRFLRWWPPVHEMLIQTFLVPPFRKQEYAIVQITYGPLHQSVEKSVLEIPPVLFKKIAEGEAANKASDIPNASGMKTLSHGSRDGRGS